MREDVGTIDIVYANGVWSGTQARRLGLALAIANFTSAITFEFLQSYISPAIVKFNFWLFFNTDDSVLGLATVNLAFANGWLVTID